MEDMALFEKNKEYMEIRFPGFMDKMQELLKKEPECEVCTYQTHDNRVGFYIQNDDGIVQLNSQYDSKIYAKIWADYVMEMEKISRHHVVVVFGFGNGDYIRALRERLPEQSYLFCYEPSADIFFKVMENIDLKEILQEKASLFVEDINMEAFNNFWENVIQLSNAALIDAVRLPAYPVLFPDKMKSLLARIEKLNERIRVLWNSQLFFAKSSALNQIQKLPYVLKIYDLVELLRRMPDNYPAIVVAAGPSLKKNIKEIKRAKNKAMIIAIDTTIQLLLKEGIVPDIYLTVDPEKPLSLFEDERVHDVPLCVVADGVTEPVKKQRRQVYISTGESYIGCMAMELGKEIIFIPSGGTVAHNAFSLAVEGGMNPIILVGQDLAFTDDRTHIEGAYHNPDKVEEMSDESVIWVEDIYGNQLKAAYNFGIYRKWYEDVIATDRMKNIRVIDATEGGVRIAGTQIMTLKEAIDTECTRTFDYEAMIDHVPLLFSEEEQEQIKEKIMALPDAFRQMREWSTDSIEEYECLKELAAEKEISIEKVKKCMTALAESTGKLMSQLEYKLIEPYIKKVSIEELYNLDEEKDEKGEDLQFVADKGLVIMKALREGIDEMLPEVETVVKELEEMG